MLSLQVSLVVSTRCSFCKYFFSSQTTAFMNVLLDIWLVFHLELLSQRWCRKLVFFSLLAVSARTTGIQSRQRVPPNQTTMHSSVASSSSSSSLQSFIAPIPCKRVVNLVPWILLPVSLAQSRTKALSTSIYREGLIVSICLLLIPAHQSMFTKDSGPYVARIVYLKGLV